jgi:hypothetical protein
VSMKDDPDASRRFAWRIPTDDFPRDHHNSSSHLVYVWEGKLLAAPFDLGKLRLTGPPAVVLDGIAMTGPKKAQFGVSDNRTGRWYMSRALARKAEEDWSGWIAREQLSF